MRVVAMIVIGVIGFLSGCAGRTGDQAPDWALTDIHGRQHTMADYRGQPVVLDFWATWCGPCRPVGPVMQSLHDRYADEGLVVLAIHFNDVGDPAAYMQEHGYTYTALVDGQEVCRRFGVSRIPTIIVLNRDGVVVHRQTGFAEADADVLASIVEGEL